MAASSIVVLDEPWIQEEIDRAVCRVRERELIRLGDFVMVFEKLRATLSRWPGWTEIPNRSISIEHNA